MSIALIPGSFDPMTLGHLDLVRRAVALYGEAVVAVMNNEGKSYDHTMEERLEMAKLTVENIPHVRVVADSGLLVELVDRIGADVIVKGVRNDSDRVYEEKMAAWNLAHNPRAKTVLLSAGAGLEAVSSTAAREKLRQRIPPHGLLAERVIDYLIGKGELPGEEENV